MSGMSDEHADLSYDAVTADDPASGEAPDLPDDHPDGEDRAGEPHGTGRAADVDPSFVETREDFAHFLSGLLADFRATGASEWENGTLDRFLDGFAAFAGARVVDVPERQQKQASWRLFAEIVQAATGYE
jgi:hypothetical protein